MMFFENIVEISYLTIILSTIVTLLIFTLFHKSSKSNLETQINILKNQNQNLEEDFLLLKQNNEEKIEVLKEHFLDSKDNLIDTYELKLSNLKEIAKNKEEELLKEFNIKEENFNEKIAFLEESKLQLKIEFENLANKLFEENQKKSNIGLTQVLGSFKDQLELFGKRVNEIYNEETIQRSSLLTEIKNLKELNNKISNDAINLTKALKGENKTQGDWGEMILSSILEQTGLREGVEYSVQGSFSDNEGKRLRPDVIVHLPSNKDIIIDSKVSLNAYLAYTKAENETTKDLATKELIKSLTAHIKGLSNKKYEDLSGIKSLDFVLMFIPIEGAFLLAISKDDNLFKMAFEHNIMIVSPSTLYVTLRTIENIWRNEHQNENAQLIAKKAGDLYDKFVNFVSDIEEIGSNINKTQKSYDNAINKLSVGRGNLIKRSEEFIELGVKSRKQLSNNLINKED
uniref:DNA recombination protein RmuC n=1 Tax=Aliarcobacter sp. TaxID=2321116 RepID=UPI004048948D